MVTFSIVARCPRTLALGVAASTAVPAVGSVVPHVKANVGAIATQAQTNIVYGTKGFELLEKGLTPQDALETMLIKDPGRRARSLAERLLKALEAGQRAGGDKRGRMSAALLVADRRWTSSGRPLLDLRADAHSNPVRELSRIYAAAGSYFRISE